jgi:hypothetical protein
MDNSLYRWITPEGEEIISKNFWGLIYKYFLLRARNKIVHLSENE